MPGESVGIVRKYIPAAVNVFAADFFVYVDN